MINGKEIFSRTASAALVRRRDFGTKIRLGPRDGNFIDSLIVRVRGGSGGDGVASFARSARIPRGKPCGGNGGDGGNVIFAPDSSLDSLNHIQKLLIAGRGAPGGGNMKLGATGQDLIVRVPLGCEIREVIEEETTCKYDKELDVNVPGTAKAYEEGDLDESDSTDFVLSASESMVMQGQKVEPKKTFHHTKIQVEAILSDSLPLVNFDSVHDALAVIAKGGRGGKGNFAYGGNNHESEKGQPGEERLVQIDLKTIADVGLVGIPNAGKSSFLAAVSNAHPKIASYPFTTLNPYVGVIEFVDGGRITVADIPGLVEGAHTDRGLGHQFLKHIVKAKLLAFVVDFAQPEPWKDVKVLVRELDLYKEGLSTKFKLVIANKADLLTGDELITRIEQTKQRLLDGGWQIDILPVSSKYSLAITRITERLRLIVQSCAHQP